MMRALLLALVPAGTCAGCWLALVAFAGPKPCEVQAHDPRLLTGRPVGDGPPPAPAFRKVTAAECPAATRIVIEQSTEGVVVERADAPPDALDQTRTVRVLILRPQADPPSAYKMGDVAVLSAVEIVISRGPLVLGD